MQHEIRVPLEDCALSRFSITIPRDSLLSAAKGVRRTCLYVLREQYARLHALRSTAPSLPPPRFSVNFCPFATQLQQEAKSKKNSFTTSKVRRHDRHDEREICPYCTAHVSVTHHSGLPDYRRILFSSHLSPSPQDHTGGRKTASFACNGCYKTFDDSYGFLDHVFQKEIGSERSCQRRWNDDLPQWQYNQVFFESDAQLVDKCLKNCLKRELTRMRTMKKNMRLGLPMPDEKRTSTMTSTVSSAYGGSTVGSTMSLDTMITITPATLPSRTGGRHGNIGFSRGRDAWNV